VETPASCAIFFEVILSPIASIAGEGGPMKGDARRLKRLGEFHVLGQEAIAGMDGLGAGLADRLHDLVDDDIGLVGGEGPIWTASSAILTCSAPRSASE
jgi:hypothetical protein